MKYCKFFLAIGLISINTSGFSQILNNDVIYNSLQNKLTQQELKSIFNSDPIIGNKTDESLKKINSIIEKSIGFDSINELDKKIQNFNITKNKYKFSKNNICDIINHVLNFGDTLC